MFGVIVGRSAPPEPAEYLLEIVAPRTNAALISPAEHLFGALALHVGAPGSRPAALEIVADHQRRWFLARASTRDQQLHLARQLGPAYPQATLRPIDPTSSPNGDPAQTDPDEQVAVRLLRLRTGEHLPLRTFQDRELDADAGSAQADPVLGILGALGDLPLGWRAVAQLVILAAAPADWARDYQRLALEDPIRAEGAANGPGPLLGPLLILGLLVSYLAGSSACTAWSTGDRLEAVGMVAAMLFLAAAGLLVYRFLTRRELHDPKLVQEKLRRDACRVELRLAVFAPAHVDPAALRTRLDRLAAAYRPYTQASGNGLVPQSIRADAADLRVMAPLGPGGIRRAALLNVRELAGLWHLPQGADDVPLVERTTARRRLPLPATVAAGRHGEGCRIGVSAHQGRVVPVHLPPGLLRRHLLAIAKTRRGKSSLMLRIIQDLMLAGTAGPGGRAAGSANQCLVVVDPHRDLALAALGLVPRERRADVVYLDVSNREYPFGINLLDVGLGWDRDQAVGNALRVFRREWDRFWGPRMEDAFRFALMGLFEANEALYRVDGDQGRIHQFTILDVPALLSLRGFRGRVLRRTIDPTIRGWFNDYFEPLDPPRRTDIINPVLTKVHKYLGSRVARRIVGQPRSTVDFRELLATRKIVVVNLSAFDVGEDIAALVGGTLLNLAARAVSVQAALAPDQRRPVTIAVDEFHTIPGADYEQVFGELAKYGANMLLATQSVSRLDQLTDGERARDLRAAVFSNLDGLFAFHTSAEDARYLVPELGGQLDEQDMLELGHYQCYARISDAATGERLPTFSVQLDPPPIGDVNVACELASASAAKYGRPAWLVDADLDNAIARYSEPRRAAGAEIAGEDYPAIVSPEPGTGITAPDRTVVGGAVLTPAPAQPKPGKWQRGAKSAKGKGRGKESEATGNGSSPSTDRIAEEAEGRGSESSDGMLQDF